MPCELLKNQDLYSMKVLVIRFSSLGDVLLTTPVMRALKQQHKATVCMATKRGMAQMLHNNPYVDRIHVLQGSLWQFANLLRAEQFDIIVDLHNNLRSRLLCLLMTKRSYRFQKLNFLKWLLVRFKTNRMPPTHVVDRYLAAAGPLKLTNDKQGLNFYISPDQKIDLNSLNGWNRQHGEPFLALVAGAAHATKRIPLPKLIEIAQQVSKPVVILGGPDDAHIGQLVAETVGDKVFNACGKFSIAGSASIIEQALCVITSDTGLMHVAAALHKPMYVVWGNTVPAFGMYPFIAAGAPPATHLEVDLPCRPCSKIGFDACPKGHFDCMMKQYYPWQTL